ncbi:hypothetical protein J4Q44_G00262820 [Coregonus suidteri]|uniref:AAR2 C-terminal domain-containing protein n=1 Tax=Coregonus suidteri TaxID=861788 RepID=A0AAN8QN07_9TELE
MREGLDRPHRMKPREGTELRFSPIPRQTYPPGATPAQITQCSPDLSYALDILLEKHQQQPLNVLGELQFSHWDCVRTRALSTGSVPWRPCVSARTYTWASTLPAAGRDTSRLLCGHCVSGQLPHLHATGLLPVCQWAGGGRHPAEEGKEVQGPPDHFEVDPDDSDPVEVELPEGITLD